MIWNNSATPIADSTDSKTTVEEPPLYENLQENLLDPSLVLNAETFRDGRSQEDKDKAFAKAVVKAMAIQLQKEPNATIFEGDVGYAYGEKKIMFWDELIGYPSLEAFKKNRVSFIVEAAKLDLRKRGFVVEKLEIVLSNARRNIKDIQC